MRGGMRGGRCGSSRGLASSMDAATIAAATIAASTVTSPSSSIRHNR